MYSERRIQGVRNAFAGKFGGPNPVGDAVFAAVVGSLFDDPMLDGDADAMMLAVGGWELVRRSNGGIKAVQPKAQKMARKKACRRQSSIDRFVAAVMRDDKYADYADSQRRGW